MVEILEIKNISKNYGGIKALETVSFQVEEGSITGLIGPNGAGKTTLFNVISGFEKPTSGTAHFEGIEITRLEPHDIVELGLCRTFQITKLFANLTCLENIMVSKKVPNSYRKMLGEIFERDDKLVNRSIEFLELVGLSDKRNEMAKNLFIG